MTIRRAKKLEKVTVKIRKKPRHQTDYVRPLYYPQPLLKIKGKNNNKAVFMV